MANQACPCVVAERPICSEGKNCRHFSNKGVCRNCFVGLLQRERRLIEVINHLRSCSECSETDILKCDIGKELWAIAGLPADSADGSKP